MSNPSDQKPGRPQHTPDTKCSFCQKHYRDVGPLVEGPTLAGGFRAYICGDCVELCALIVAQEKWRPRAVVDHDTEHPPDDAVFSTEDSCAIREQIDTVLLKLSEVERKIVKLRYGLEDGWTYTLEEVGEKLGIAPARIREIETQAVEKLKEQR